jgi:S-adenosylmethionine:tRNA ribosyltransferase-isomerase
VTLLIANPSLPDVEELDPLQVGGQLEFDLPDQLEATEPPEARGLERDQVRLMVSHYLTDRVTHTSFRAFPEYLEPGDVLVINTSATLKAALNARRADGSLFELHLSTHLQGELWIAELRQLGEKGSEPFLGAHSGEILTLPGGASARLLKPHDPRRRNPLWAAQHSVRLWIATLDLPAPAVDYLDEFGFPIRYAYVRDRWPIEAYQTIYATEPGSAEMPSAGRAFSSEILARLSARGVQVLPLLLHTGVSTPEAGEAPLEEYYRIPAETASGINRARARERRIIAVGTTSVRAVETAALERGIVSPAQGWTRLVITPERGLRVVDGLLTGFHEPRSSHLALLTALAGRHHVARAYQEALEQKYLWHEFGDLHLILP